MENKISKFLRKYDANELQFLTFVVEDEAIETLQ
jgi:hypothetical protein